MQAGIHAVLNLIGLKIQGDLGPITCYTSARGPVVWYIKSPPDKPPSPPQQALRDAFRSAAIYWRALDEAARLAWTRAARRANLRITAYNLWTYAHITQDAPTIATIAHQTGIPLEMPPPPD